MRRRLSGVAARLAFVYLGADAPVAQLDRALPSEGKGHKFESCRARQFHPNQLCHAPRSRHDRDDPDARPRARVQRKRVSAAPDLQVRKFLKDRYATSGYHWADRGDIVACLHRRTISVGHERVASDFVESRRRRSGRAARRRCLSLLLAHSRGARSMAGADAAGLHRRLCAEYAPGRPAHHRSRQRSGSRAHRDGAGRQALRGDDRAAICCAWIRTAASGKSSPIPAGASSASTSMRRDA